MSTAPVKKPVNLPFLPKDVEDLVLWRKPKEAGAIFGGATAAYLAYVYNPFNGFTIVSYLLSIISLALFLWSHLGHFVSRSGPPVPEFLVKGVTQEQARQVADAALPVVNKALGYVGVLASGKDLKTSSLVVVGSYTAGRIFALASPFTLAYVVVVLAFVLPKAYEAKQDEVDKVLAVVKAKVDEAVTAFNNNVLSKIPKAQPPAPKKVD
ncbi:hypothetical protein CHLRE_06g308950v5 [Chlamydomonas reinhardtii]|uniref:Reticulon-like protein n=1 Tax=Chlamydomonas reinhardtii TaxID=3055 RepID=A0A2K3DRI8_CHLRE|nr:uncharacterized protein CHLRE_06g308950v5 [Chlamydomonas reinhardtii]PNW83154.1 hypothetical protein CHLRE_06g308950v5 [Chlamydomonas reinhardtii]